MFEIANDKYEEFIEESRKGGLKESLKRIENRKNKIGGKMNAKEKTEIEELKEYILKLSNENKEFKTMLVEKDKLLNEKIDKKNLPISLEEAILQSVQINIKDVFDKYMQITYNNPIHKIIEEVILRNKEVLGIKIEESILNSIQNKDNLKEEIEGEFVKKLAKSIISAGDSMIEKSMNSLKQDHKFKAELLLAVSNVVSSFKDKL